MNITNWYFFAGRLRYPLVLLSMITILPMDNVPEPQIRHFVIPDNVSQGRTPPSLAPDSASGPAGAGPCSASKSARQKH